MKKSFLLIVFLIFSSAFLLAKDNERKGVQIRELLTREYEKGHLPEVFITTASGKKILYDEERKWLDATIKITTADENTILLEPQQIKIRQRGNSTSGGIKKAPYAIKFLDNTSVLGMNKAKKWVLLANYYDRTLLRTRFSSYLGTKIFNTVWNASFVPVNLFVNGVFNGTYDFGEQIVLNKNRINVPQVRNVPSAEKECGDNDDLENSDLENGGFLFEIDSRNGEEFHFYSDTCHLPINFKDPDSVTEEQFAYGEKIINHVEEILFADDFASHYEEVIDAKSFADWYIVNEFAKNTDSVFQSSVYLYYNPADKKIYLGPNWDFDLAFGNAYECYDAENFFVYGGKKYNDYDFTQKRLTGEPYFRAKWINRLFECSSFKYLVKERWISKNKSLYNAINVVLPSYAKQIEMHIPANEKFCSRLGKESWNGPYDWETRLTYQSEVDFLIDWCNRRYIWLDKEIRSW